MGIIAVYIVTNGSGQLYYTLTDHLGSIIALMDENGNIVEETNYDPWGRTRNPNTWHYDNTAGLSLIFRGFTGHSLSRYEVIGKMLPEFGLINMNGRLYDPALGRFLSPDNYVQDPNNPQNYNRYTYALNNPLKYTDPDGEFFWIPFIAMTIFSAAESAENLSRQYRYMHRNPTSGAIIGASMGIVTSFIGLGMGSLGASIGITGALPCAAWGAASGGIVGGLAGGATSYSLTSNFWSGAKAGGISGAITGGVMGGISGYTSAKAQGRNVWTGKKYPPDNAFASSNDHPYKFSYVNELKNADPESPKGRLWDYRGGYLKGVKFDINNPIIPNGQYQSAGWLSIGRENILVSGFKGNLNYNYFGEVPLGASIKVSYDGTYQFTISPGTYIDIKGIIPMGTNNISLQYIGFDNSGLIGPSSILNFQVTGYFPFP